MYYILLYIILHANCVAKYIAKYADEYFALLVKTHSQNADHFANYAADCDTLWKY